MRQEQPDQSDDRDASDGDGVCSSGGRTAPRAREPKSNAQTKGRGQAPVDCGVKMRKGGVTRKELQDQRYDSEAASGDGVQSSGGRTTPRALPSRCKAQTKGRGQAPVVGGIKRVCTPSEVSTDVDIEVVMGQKGAWQLGRWFRLTETTCTVGSESDSCSSSNNKANCPTRSLLNMQTHQLNKMEEAAVASAVEGLMCFCTMNALVQVMPMCVMEKSKRIAGELGLYVCQLPSHHMLTSVKSNLK